jgi:hypothetical protein
MKDIQGKLDRDKYLPKEEPESQILFVEKGSDGAQ